MQIRISTAADREEVKESLGAQLRAGDSKADQQAVRAAIGEYIDALVQHAGPEDEVIVRVDVAIQTTVNPGLLQRDLPAAGAAVAPMPANLTRDSASSVRAALIAEETPRRRIRAEGGLTEG